MRHRTGLASLIASVAFVAACAGAAGSTVEGSDDFAEIPGVGATRIDVPRPAGVASAACDADPLPSVADQPLVDRVHDLRAIGFFADEGGVPDADVARSIQGRLTETWGDAIGPDDPIFELAVAETDHDRVWWMDLEADVVDENQVYVSTLETWSAISVGAFTPTAVEEVWEGPSGSVTLRFVQAGIAHELKPGYLDDWIDPRILIGVNAAITDSGRRFEMVKAFDQTAYVLALTDGERTALEGRGWCFE